jgi:Fe2+ or Zn2+ uptake regulation protein
MEERYVLRINQNANNVLFPNIAHQEEKISELVTIIILHILQFLFKLFSVTITNIKNKMKNTSLDKLLKDKNLSFTQQRRVILEELENTDSHLTADEVYFKVKKRMPHVSVGTIYRNLSVLVDLKLVDKVDTSFHTESHYEINHDDHYHIICEKCLRIDDLEHFRALSIEPTAEKISSYKILRHSIELIGICPKCKPKIKTEDTLPLDKKDNSTRTPSPSKNPVSLPKENTEENQARSSQISKKRRFFFGHRNHSKL